MRYAISKSDLSYYLFTDIAIGRFAFLLISYFLIQFCLLRWGHRPISPRQYILLISFSNKYPHYENSSGNAILGYNLLAI